MIAVTGMGIVSAYGIGTETFISGALERQGLNPVTYFDAAKYGTGDLGCVRDFSTKGHIQPMKARRLSRFSQLALVSALEAWKASGLAAGSESAARTGVIVGTGLGSVSSTDSFFEGLVLRGGLETNPMIFPETVQNIAAAHISMELGIKGPNTTFSQGDIAGECALAYAAGLLEQGSVDAVVVCGADELTEPLLIGMRTLRILSRTGTLRPFDRRRDGILLAEGAATIILERAEDAARRGAKSLGHLRAFGSGSDTVERFSYPSADAMARTMDAAIKAAGTAPDFISASANSTVELDRSEAAALKQVFGKTVPVTCLKSQTGSFMASGVMKVAAALLSMQRGLIPPIHGLAEPEVPGINYISEMPLAMKATSCLVNGFSHGGGTMSVVVTAA